MNRRRFLQSGAASVGLALSMKGLQATEARRPVIRNHHPDMPYRQVPGTDAWLSVIGLGAFNVTPSVFEYALDHGVNLFHISLHYQNMRSIKELGQFLKGRRDRVYIALKDEFDHIDEALTALATDSVDFIMFNRHGKPVATDPKIRDTYLRLKELGKVRYAGLTSHGDVKNATAGGIESGMYHIVMPALTPANFSIMGSELQLAQQKGVGIMVMKATRGIEDPDRQMIHLKKVLAQPAVTTVLRSITEFAEIQRHVKTVRETLTGSEEWNLYRYCQDRLHHQCLMCDTCSKACPQHVEISTIVRCVDYYNTELKDRRKAVSEYQTIPPHLRGNQMCLSCQRCETVCPNKLSIVEKLIHAREILS